jgi:hypothetical protein
LLFIGSLIWAMQGLFYAIILPLIIQDYSEAGKYFSFIRVISLLGSICFCIGLSMLIQKSIPYYQTKK